MDPTYYGQSAPSLGRRKSSPGLSRKMMFVIIGGVVAVILGAVMLIISNARNPAGEVRRLEARLATLSSLITLGEKNIQSDSLSKINADARILVTGHSRSIKTAAKGIGVKGPDKNDTKAEADESTFTDLKSAAVNGNFDRSYIQSLTQKISDTTSLMNAVYDKTNNTALRSALAASYKELNEIKIQLNKLTL